MRTLSTIERARCGTLLALRTASDLTQDEAAELCGVSTRTYRGWETGQNPVPSARYSLALRVLDPKAVRAWKRQNKKAS